MIKYVKTKPYMCKYDVICVTKPIFIPRVEETIFVEKRKYVKQENYYIRVNIL